MANTIKAVKATTPFNTEDTMSHISVDTAEYLTLEGVTELGQHALQLWIKSSKPAPIIMGYGAALQSIVSETEWTRVEWLFTATDINAVYLFLPVGEYWIYNTKLEKGNKFTDYTIAPEDVDTAIQDTKTIATQTADRFNWLVKSGTSATDFTLTDRMAKLTAEIISLNGDVQIDGDMIVDGAVTAKKLKIDDLSALDATIGAWKITNKAIYNDAMGSDGYIRRAYIQSMGVGEADKSWVFSVQKALQQGNTPTSFKSHWRVTGDGDMTTAGALTCSGDTHISGKLLCDGGTTIKGDVKLEGYVEIESNASIVGNLTVPDGFIRAEEMVMTSGEVAENFDVLGDYLVAHNILIVGGDTLWEGNMLNCHGNAIFDGDVTTTGGASLNDLLARVKALEKKI